MNRAEREQLAGARSVLARLVEAARKHAQLCRTCRRITGTQARWCDEGWELAVQIKQAQQRVEHLAAPIEGGQLTLF